MIDDEKYTETEHKVRASSFALLIGIDRYKHDSNRPLRCARRDVEAVANVLKGPGWFLSDNISVLCDEQATREGIGEAFEKIREAVQTVRTKRWHVKVRLLFYFAGHGYIDHGKREHKTFLATFETREHLVRASGFDYAQIDALIEQIQPDQDLRILDCCHAGGVVASRGNPDDSVDSLIDAATKAEGRATFFACNKQQKAYEPASGDGLSYFAKFFVDAIISEVPDNRGIVKINDVAEYVSENVSKKVSSELKKQQIPFLVMEARQGPLAIAFRPDSKSLITAGQLDRCLAAINKQIAQGKLVHSEGQVLRELLAQRCYRIGLTQTDEHRLDALLAFGQGNLTEEGLLTAISPITTPGTRSPWPLRLWVAIALLSVGFLALIAWFVKAQVGRPGSGVPKPVPNLPSLALPDGGVSSPSKTFIAEQLLRVSKGVRSRTGQQDTRLSPFCPDAMTVLADGPARTCVTVKSLGNGPIRQAAISENEYCLAIRSKCEINTFRIPWNFEVSDIARVIRSAPFFEAVPRYVWSLDSLHMSCGICRLRDDITTPTYACGNDIQPNEASVAEIFCVSRVSKSQASGGGQSKIGSDPMKYTPDGSVK